MRSFLLPYPVLLLLFSSLLHGQIPVLPAGTGLLTFEARPPASEWSTAYAPGPEVAATTTNQLDALVLTNQASLVTNTLLSTGTDGKFASARWNSNNFNLQMRPIGTAYTLLLATLQNQTATNVPYLQISYDFGLLPGSYFLAEDIPGWRAYFSFTGLPDSWMLIPELSTGMTGSLTTTLDLGTWTPGSNLFLLWADDNAANEVGSFLEGPYTLDNFSAIPVDRLPLKVSLTPQTQVVSLGEAATLSAVVRGGTPPYAYAWFKDHTNSALPAQTGSTLTVTNAQPADSGTYSVRVTDSTSGTPEVSWSTWATLTVDPSVFLSVVDNRDGTVTISWEPAQGTLQESTNLVNWAASSNQANNAPRSTVNLRFYRVR